MGKLKCTECGQIFEESLKECPNCACPASECEKVAESNTIAADALSKTDWANNVYECGVLFWNTLTKRYFQFNGRASRLEYWNFVIVSMLMLVSSSGIGGVLLFIPLLAVSVRRFHDINRSDWWILVPWASFFFQFKKSDEGVNDYGVPFHVSI